MEDYFHKQLSERQKTKERAKKVIDMLIPNAITQTSFFKDYEIMRDNYRLYNNIIEPEEFAKWCNPIGLDTLALTEVQPYNKSYQNIDVLLGEELDRKETPRAVAIGNNSVKSKDYELQQVYKAYIAQEINKAIEKAQMLMQGASEEEIKAKMEELTTALTPDDEFVSNYKSELETVVNKIINYAYFTEDINSLKNEGFFHALIADRELIWVGEENGKPIIRICNPLYTFFDKSPNTKYIQDGNYAGHITRMTVADVIALYSDEMTSTELDRLQENVFGSTDLYGGIDSKIKVYREKVLDTRLAKGSMDVMYYDEDGLHGSSYTNSIHALSTKIEVVHVEWKWLRKIGYLTITNELEDVETIFVDEGYPVPKDALTQTYNNKFDKKVKRHEWNDEFGTFFSLEWIWLPDIWEGTRIDKDIFVKVRRKPNQVYSIHNPFDVKIGYHGVKYNATNAPSISIMGRMKPFVFFYIICMHQMGELVARNDGPIRDIDLSQIDLMLGDGDIKDALQKTIAYQKKGFNFYNSMNNTQGGNINSRPKQGIENASSSVDILNLAKVLEWLEIEIGKAAGISPQRASRFSSSSNVTDNQQAIIQSALITEKYFNKHSKLWNEVISSYVTMFRKWIYDRLQDDEEEMYLQYILPNQGIEALKITKDTDLLGDVGIFITSTNETYKYANKLEQLSLTLLQNDQANFEDISNILRARIEGVAPQEVHKMILISQQKQQKREEAMQQQAMEIEKMKKDAMMEAHQMRLQEIVVKEQEVRKTQELIAQLKGEYSLEENILDNSTDLQIEDKKSKTSIEVAKINAKKAISTKTN